MQEGPIPHAIAINPARVPRARGTLDLCVQAGGGLSRLERLHQSGSFRCLFPRSAQGAFEAVLVNTAGGITGGDRFDTNVVARRGSTLTLTTQAAERAYRSAHPAAGRMTTRIRVESGARVNWLPQETILFDGCRYERSLRIDLEGDARALVVEPLVFGRVAMGETLDDIRFCDRIDLRRNGAPLYLDAMTLAGNAHRHLARPHIAAGARAMASLVYAAPDAEARLTPLRKMLPAEGGASLLRENLLVLRLLAPDSFELRKHLIPILEHLNTTPLPKCWMI